MKYKIVFNHCQCHPETCCCNPYKVINNEGNSVATFYNQQDAIKLVNLLNNK